MAGEQKPCPILHLVVLIFYVSPMDQTQNTLLQSDWYSPRRLHDSPTKYHFPGDRFIPNRSLMNLDQAHSLLTNRVKEVPISNFSETYRQKLIENINLDIEGRPFKMLVFRGSPKSNKKWMNHIEEMQRDDAEELKNSKKKYERRSQLPEEADRILDAPEIKNDYYLNIIDWGKNNFLAVALGQRLYLWNSVNKSIVILLQVEDGNDYPTSISWSDDRRSLAVGFWGSRLQIWDTETCKCIHQLEGHNGRVFALSWNVHTLTSGSEDKSIINHDVRMQHPTSCIRVHTKWVCGLKWSEEGNLLASGGNDNKLYIWEASKLSSSNFLHQFTEHNATVKALAWCPHHANVLASGGGIKDGCVKLWNTQKGTCIGNIETKTQVCALEWNRHHKELLSGHGYRMAAGKLQNHLSLWKYPSLTEIGHIKAHTSRVIGFSQSPDGLTVVSAGADETLRFWEIFGPASKNKSDFSGLDALLSLKTSPIR